MSLLHSRRSLFIATASVLERFVAACKDIGLGRMPKVRAVFAGSEAILPHHLVRVQNEFEAPVVGWYGQSEQVCLAALESPGTYAVVPGYSDVAFIRREHSYEIVGRSRANPLFGETWYRTGDHCREVFVGQSSTLGVDTIVMSGLHGRVPKFATSRSERLIPVNHLIFGFHSSRLSAVSRYCLVQDAPGAICFVWWSGDKGSVDTELILKSFARRFGHDFEFSERFEPRLRDLSAPKWTYYFADWIEYERILSSNS